MSYKTWSEEFYPIFAEDINQKGVSEEELIQHSLTKWKGILPENLKKHGGKLFTATPTDDPRVEFEDRNFYLGTDTCSLCIKYWYSCCYPCPLQQQGDECGKKESPYNVAVFRGDIVSIVNALQKALDKEKETKS